MLGLRGFGDSPEINLSNYQRIVVPDIIMEYMGGHFIDNPGNRYTPPWSVEYPLDKHKSETLYYENTMSNLISSVLAAYNSFKPGNPTLKNAYSIIFDINQFNLYNQIKNQDIYDLTTMNATNKYYKTYFGDFSAYAAIMKWLGEQSSLAGQELLDKSALFVAQINYDNASVKQKFYREKIVPIANRFSQKDQGFLRDIFLFQLEGETSLEDLVKAIKMIAPLMTMADLTVIMQFGAQMILGNDLANNVLNSSYSGPSHLRNIGQEIAEISGKYNAVTSRIGKYLPENTNALFDERLNILRKAVLNPNDPKYYVCGDICSTINQNFMDAIVSGIMEGMTGAYTPTDSAAIYKRAATSIQAAITPDGTSGEKFPSDGAESMLAPRNLNLDSSSGASGVGLLLLGAGALFLMFKEK